VVQSAPAPGEAGTVRLARRVDGAPLYGGDVAVEVDAGLDVTLVSTGDVPAEVKGTPRISRKSAVKAARKAIPGLEAEGEPRAERGWRAVGKAVRPVWRVDIAARKPPGDWRSFVDAETGKVLLRTDHRVTGPR
jgi:Zn-dependent metalloprotease